MGKRLEIHKGDKFNRLTIIKEVEKVGQYRHFKCKCECGNITNVRLSSLRNNHIQSCGCLHIEMCSKLNYKHGLFNKRIYSIYSGVKQRCNNKKHKSYKNYGGRGIKCEWNSFEEFYKDMNNSYKKHLQEYGAVNTTIDRINNDGNYSKYNCRWATWKEQNRNTRFNVVYKGKCMIEWCEELGLNKDKVRYLRNKGLRLKSILQLNVK